MGHIIAIHGNEETLIKELMKNYKWVLIDLNENKKRLMVNYFGAEPTHDFTQANGMLELLADEIKPGFWFEEGLKQGIGRTEYNSVIVPMLKPEYKEIAEMYGYTVVSRDESVKPDILIKEGKTTEEFINELRERTKEITDSETMG